MRLPLGGLLHGRRRGAFRIARRFIISEALNFLATLAKESIPLRDFALDSIVILFYTMSRVRGRVQKFPL